MGLDVAMIVSDLVIFANAYEERMVEGKFIEEDKLAAKIITLAKEMQNEAWHSHHTSGTGAV